MEHREDRVPAEPGGPSASQQLADVLLQVITEQNVFLAGHLKRVSELSRALAEVLGLPEPEIQRIWLAGRLHDIGMTAVPALMFQRLEPFDASNWALMRLSPLIGERIVSAAPALVSTAPLIRSSHEQIDGQGYPDRLAGENIPLGSRIIAVCDAFAAMTSPYWPRKGVAAALEELERCSGTQFDAAIVKAFCATTELHGISAAPQNRPSSTAETDRTRRSAPTDTPSEP